MSEENGSEDEEIICIMTLGISSVGKTSFILRFTQNTYTDSYLATVGYDFKSKNIIVKDQLYKLLLYDTAGQERYKSMAPNMIKMSHGIIIMYDITNYSSFNSVPEYIDKIKELKGDKFPIILIGNKIDKERERLVSEDEGKSLAEQYGIDFIEISNREGINIEEAGMNIVNRILEERKNESITGSKNPSNSQSLNSSKYSNIDGDGCNRC